MSTIIKRLAAALLASWALTVVTYWAIQGWINRDQVDRLERAIRANVKATTDAVDAERERSNPKINITGTNVDQVDAAVQAGIYAAKKKERPLQDGVW